jgi:hypothetical protein
MSHQRLSWDFVLAGNNDCMIPSHSSHARDAALRRLVLTKRWLIAGSVTLTGVFTAVAANAFPGKTIKSSGARAASAGHSSKTPTPHQHTQSSQGSSSSLQPPAQAPQSTTPQESAPAQEPTPAHEPTPAPESAPAQESAPAKESAPAQEPAPVEHSEPAQPAPEAPVVSGGS